MAAKPYNRGGLDEGLAEYLGLKGRLNSDVDSTIQPIVQVTDLADSPYVRDSVPAAVTNFAAAAALEYSHVGVQVGLGMALQVKQVRLVNNNASNLLATLAVVTGSFVDSLLATASSSNVVQLFQALVGGPQGGAGTLRPSRSVGATAPILGPFNELDTLIVPASSAVTLVYPDPGILLLTTPGNPRAAFFARWSTVNFGLSASFYAREWPIPG